MVNDTPLLQQCWHTVRADFARLRASHRRLPQPAPGLHTWRTTTPDGHERRLHLRVDPPGSGTLFIDVTDVIHLNATAVPLAVLALDGVPADTAHTIMRRTFRAANAQQLREDVAQVYALIAHARANDSSCVCGIGTVQQAPIFSTRAGAPYKADLALTYGCNNGCAHCYNEPDRLAMPSLPRAAWQQVIDTLHRAGVPHLIFTGGEATLHPDLLDLITYADQRGHIVGLNTNGRRMAQPAFTAELAAAGLNHVQVTLGSSRPAIHDEIMQAQSFAQTVRGIENALASRMHVITNTTLMRRTMDHVEEIISFLHRLGIRTFAMNGMIYSGGGFADPQAIPEDQLAPLLVRVRDHAADLGMRFLWYTPTEYCRMSPVELELGAKRCNAGEYSICVEPDGSVLPCQSYYVAAGNILTDPWESIWRSDLFRSFREREDDPVWAGLPAKCHACPDLPLCGGGCRIEREARDGHRIAAGGCSSGGCSSGGCSTSEQPAPALGGFIPVDGLTRAPVRGRGNDAGEMLIPLTAVTHAPAPSPAAPQAKEPAHDL